MAKSVTQILLAAKVWFKKYSLGSESFRTKLATKEMKGLVEVWYR